MTGTVRWFVGCLIAAALVSAASAQPVNDACNAPTPLAYPGDAEFDLAAATASGLLGCGARDDIDVWYSFRAPIRQMYRFETSGDAAIDTTLAIFGFCPASGPGTGTWIACNDDTSLREARSIWSSRIDQELAANQTVLVRVAGWGGTRPSGRLTISTAHVGDPPANDACEHAAVLKLGRGEYTSNIAATGTDLSSCGSNDTNDVWYRFTAPIADTYSFDIEQTDFFATMVTVLDSCDVGSSAERACGVQHATVTMAAGESVLVRVAIFEELMGDFLLRVNTVPPSTPTRPANADCNAAIAFAAPGTVYGSTIGGDRNVGFGEQCASPAYGPAVYVRVTFPTAGPWVVDTDGSPEEIPFFLAAFAGCNDTGVAPQGLITCHQPFTVGTPNRILLQTTEPNQEVTLYVCGTLYRSGLFRLNIQPPPEPPSNDSCFTARTVSSPSLNVQDNFFARQDGNSPICARDDVFAVWYDFTASTAGSYKFDGKLSDGAAWFHSVAVYDACGGSVLGCNQSVVGASTVGLALAAGQRVMIRQASDGGWVGKLALRIGSGDAPAPTAAPGACCIGAGGCSIQADGRACTSVGGAFSGANTTCGLSDNPLTCCRANIDRIQGVQLGDLFAYLNAFFAGTAPAEFDGAPGVNVGDLFVFLAAWFSGCD